MIFTKVFWQLASHLHLPQINDAKYSPFISYEIAKDLILYETSYVTGFLKLF